MIPLESSDRYHELKVWHLPSTHFALYWILIGDGDAVACVVVYDGPHQYDAVVDCW